MIQCPQCRTLMPSRAPGTEINCPNCAHLMTVPLDHDVLKPGTRLGNLRIDEIVGTGGMGHVYRATDLSLSRPVAVKVLASDHNVDGVGKRFLNEMRLLASIEHPNIVTVFSAGEDQGFTYLSMALINGMSLDELLEQAGGTLREREVLRIAGEVARGLDYAYRKKGILHRDIKPPNIMVTHAGDVKLLDLGIAQRLAQRLAQRADSTQQGMAIGTPQYMSPEQAKAHDLDCRSDMYSLGATMYHLLAGACPFDGESAMEIMAQVVRAQPTPLSSLRKNLSPACITLVHRLLAKEPEDRFDDWQELRIEIQRVANGIQNHERRRIRRKRIRHLAKWIGLALLASLALWKLIAP